MSTAHMLSQLTKTIKMALKSTEEDRAVLRARSALQRFPVVEWRQRMEDFHRRSINASRDLAGAEAWRESDCDGGSGGLRPVAEADWNPVDMDYPSQPAWDRSSLAVDSPAGSPLGSPGYNNSVENLASDESVITPPRLHASSLEDGDAASTASYDDFLSRANRAIARDQRHAPDPFIDAEFKRPARPFSSHSRVSSASSIADVADEHSTSPLNQAIASVGIILYSKNSSTHIMTPSLRMPTEEWPQTSFKSYRTSLPRILSMNCLSKST